MHLVLKIVLSIITPLLVLATAFVIATDKVLVTDDLAGCQQPSDVGRCQKADVIVAVSGGNTLARAERAVDLYKKGWAPKVIFSGAAADPTTASNAEMMRRYAIKRGVPEAALVVEGGSRNTKENAANSSKLLRSLGAQRAILVSSPYHLHRVKSNFEKIDHNISYRTTAAHDRLWRLWFFKPKGWSTAIVEWGGIMELSAGVHVK